MTFDERTIVRLLRRVDLLERRASRQGHGHVLGYAEVTSSQTAGTTGRVDLVGLSVTVEVAANRRIHISGNVQLSKQTNPGRLQVVIREGSTDLGRLWRGDDFAVGERWRGHGATVVESPSAGSHTYKLSGETDTNGFVSEAAATEKSYILVEDIGPA